MWRRGREGGTGEEENKTSSGTKKGKSTFTRDSTHPPHNPNETDKTLPARGAVDNTTEDVFADYLRTLWQMGKRRRGRNGCDSSCCKETMCSNPYCPGCCCTLLFSSICHNYLKDLPQELHFSSRNGFCGPVRRRRHGEEFKIYDLVGINGGFWYGYQSLLSGVIRLTKEQW